MTTDHLKDTPRQAWVIVGLLFLCQVINFFDKSVMGLAALPIMAAFGLSQKEYGLIASSFFSLYALSGIAVGLFFVNRIGPKWLLVVLVVIWSLSQFPPALTASVWVLVASRIALGVGEGPGTPSSYNACYTWFPSEKRNLPTALIIAGAGAGPLIGGPVLTYVIMSHGWRAAFLLCGCLGAVWLLVWLVFGAEGPYAVRAEEHRGDAGEPVSNTRFWTDPTMIGSLIVGFSAYWITGFTIAWVAPYLQSGLGFSPRTTGTLVAAISGTGSLIILMFSFISQRMLKAGMSSRHARGFVNGFCVLAGGAFLFLGIAVDDHTLKLILLTLGLNLPLVTFAIGPAIVAEIAPPAKRGPALLIAYSGVTLAGFIAPALSGILIQNAGPEALAIGYGHAVELNAVVVMLGGIAGLLLLRPEGTIRRFASR